MAIKKNIIFTNKRLSASNHYDDGLLKNITVNDTLKISNNITSLCNGFSSISLSSFINPNIDFDDFSYKPNNTQTNFSSINTTAFSIDDLPDTEWEDVDLFDENYSLSTFKFPDMNCFLDENCSLSNFKLFDINEENDLKITWHKESDPKNTYIWQENINNSPLYPANIWSINTEENKYKNFFTELKELIKKYENLA